MSAGTEVLLGRDAEVADAVAAITGVSGGYVALVGAAGIGKSALLRTVSEGASQGGLVVRTSTGAVSESDLPFIGLHDLIGDDVPAELPEALQDALDVALLRIRPAGAGVDPLALNLAVLRVMENLCAVAASCSPSTTCRGSTRPHGRRVCPSPSARRSSTPAP